MEVQDLARVPISYSVVVNQQKRVHSVWKLTDAASQERDSISIGRFNMILIKRAF